MTGTLNNNIKLIPFFGSVNKSYESSGEQKPLPLRVTEEASWKQMCLN